MVKCNWSHIQDYHKTIILCLPIKTATEEQRNEEDDDANEEEKRLMGIKAAQ